MRTLTAVRSALLTAVFVCAGLVAVSPPLALWVHGRPGVAAGSLVVCALCAAIAFVARRLRLPLELTLVLLLPFAAAWGLGEGAGLFRAVRRFDLLVHFTAGACLGAIGAGVGLALPLRPRREVWAAIAGLSAAALLGSVWEVGELLADSLLGAQTLVSARNVVLDLAADLLGGAVGVAAALFAQRTLSPEQRARLSRPFVRLRAESA